MIEIRLGSRPQERREERFADGAVTVRSRKGVRAAERGLLDALPRDKEGSALVVNSIEGLAGMVLRALNPGLRVHCHFDDAWDFEAAQRTVDRHPDLAPCLAVAADPPEGPWDLVVLPVEQDDPTDLVRERLRDAVGWLTPTGLLIGSTSNPKDRFLREEIRAVFGPPTIVEGKTRTTGTTYIARAPGEPGNLRGPGARTFTVREEQAELTFVSRPGVFCYGRLDAGSRTLLEHLDVGETRRILDLGCGTGVLGIVAAVRRPEAHVTLVDSYARAVECAERNAVANGVADRCGVRLTPDARRDLEPGYDLVVTNPPYYGNYRISERFLAAAARVLDPGGRLVLVTKGVEWHVDRMRAVFGHVEALAEGDYAVLCARR